jgi:uncharacterized damage-inducible protein DinB
MNIGELLVDAFDRVRSETHDAVEGVSADLLVARPGNDGNSIAWLVWHLTRIQDDHVSDVAGTEQVWTAQEWYRQFALPFAASDTGYGHSPDYVAQVAIRSGALLLGYYDAVHEHTIAYVRALDAGDLDRIVDSSWDPPVTLGTRLVSVIADDLQHVGQAAFVRGILER